jgi:hypothetical protein
MIDAIKFVQAATTRNKSDNLLHTHFIISEGRISATNGVLTLSSPIELDFECAPNAISFSKAISSANNDLSIVLTKAGRLSVKTGQLKVFVSCANLKKQNDNKKTTKVENFDGEDFLKMLSICYGFISDDISRAWSNGCLLVGQGAYATNNTILIEHWHNNHFHIGVNIPKQAIKEITKLKEAPISCEINESCICLNYESGKKIISQLIVDPFLNVARILQSKSNQTNIDESIFTAIEEIRPFCDRLGRIYFEQGVIKTSLSENDGAERSLRGFEVKGCYQADSFMLLRNVAKTIDLTAHPNPCLFFGKNLRGAIMGMRV